MSQNTQNDVAWIDKLPANWQLLPTKRAFRREKAINVGMACENRLALTMQGVVPRDIDDLDGLQSSDFEGYQIFEKGDLAFKLIDLQNIKTSRVGLVPDRGIMSPAYIRLVPTGLCDVKFGYWYFMALYWTQVFNGLGGGVRQTLGPEELGNIPLPLPPKSEQLAIANFLDRETTKIDALIEEQQRLIELLKEKRQAVISHAVTKGLDPSVPMKDSGVEWLGQVPVHWEVGPIKHWLNVLPGFAFPSTGFLEEGQEATRLLRGINVGVQEVRWDETVYWRRMPDDGLDRFALGEGDIVLGMDRPWISGGTRIAKITESDLPCLLLQRVACLRPNAKLLSDFCYALYQCTAFEAFVTPDLTGVSVPHLSPEQIKSFPIAVPPISEQLKITSFLSHQFEKLDALSGEAEEAITLLQERRAALISAAVTGKIDVRGLVSDEAEAA
ncbi:restriction endonuclease subunit S [Rhizobiales bacterium TNE-4]|nr:restriction endonuclease subunit S [Rhizobiales bacterium TNE-4]MBV1827103.1 restriction endonuclease subunit S [Rhizobiales bacterium TNE-4]